MISGNEWVCARMRGGGDSLGYRKGRSKSRRLVNFGGIYGSKVVMIVEGGVGVGDR